MPDTQGAPAGGGRQILGQPWWIWAAGGAALIGGYIYLRRKASASAAAAAQQSPAGATVTTTSPTGMGWEQFLLFLHDQQSSPAAAATPAKTATPPAGTKTTTAPTGEKLYWSGDLKRWMTAEQWHDWHVAHEQHLASTGGKG
jgi:hypothetical protein